MPQREVIDIGTSLEQGSLHLLKVFNVSLLILLRVLAFVGIWRIFLTEISVFMLGLQSGCGGGLKATPFRGLCADTIYTVLGCLARLAHLVFWPLFNTLLFI